MPCTSANIFSQTRYIRIAYAEDGGELREDVKEDGSPYGVTAVPGGWYTLPQKFHDAMGDISENY